MDHEDRASGDVIDVGGIVVAVTIDDGPTRHTFSVSFASIATEHTPDVQVHLRAEADRHVLMVDGQDVYRSVDPTNAVDHLVAWINREAVRSRRDRVNLHAAGLIDPVHGRLVLVPGGPGAGKTTTAATACASGWGYLSDELIGIEADGIATGHAKPLTIKTGSVPLVDFDEARWTTSPRQRRWYLPATTLGGHVGSGRRAHAVMFTRYDADANPTVTDLGVAAATLELATHCQDDLDPDGMALEAIAEVAASAHAAVVTQREPADGLQALRLITERPRREPTPVTRIAPAGASVEPVGPGRGPGVVSVATVDGAVLHDAGSGKLLQLDTIGALIWQVLDGSVTETELAAELATSFDHAVDDVAADVGRLLATLRDHGMLAG